MKKQDVGFRRRFYRTSLIMILLIASIPGLITGAGIYWSVTGKIESELQALHQNQIWQRAKNIDDQLSFLELTFSHWSFDTNFDDKLKSLDFVYKYGQVQELFRTLIVIEGSHPLIGNVDIYLEKPRPLVMNKERYSYLSDPGVMANYAALLKQGKSVLWSGMQDTGPGGSPGEGGRLTLINKLSGGGLEPFGVLVATLDMNKLNELLKTLTPYNEGATLLLGEDKEWLITSDTPPSPLDEALRREVIRRGPAGEPFLFTYKGITYSVSCGTFSRLGGAWTFVSAAPLTTVTSPVLFISKVILGMSAAGLLLALLLSWFASVRLYSPIDRLMGTLLGGRGALDRSQEKDEFAWIEKHWNSLATESKSLREILDRQMPLVRESFLLQLVQGYLFSLNEAEIRERFYHFGWEAGDVQFAVMMLRMRGLSRVEAKFASGDEELVTFAATNIAGELAANQGLQAEALNFHDMSGGILLMLPGQAAAKKVQTDLQLLARTILEEVERNLKLQVTVSISRTSNQMKQIPYLFEEARHALGYRDLLDESQIIDDGQFERVGTQREFTYPFSLEKEIVHSIRMGSEEEAVTLIRQFLDDLSAGGATELMVHQGMLQLLGTILHAMLESGLNPVQLFDGANPFGQLSDLKDSEDILKWFQFKVVGVFVYELISKQDFHLKQMVEKVILYLKERYMTDLSLDACAEHFGTSPFTLSRAFKQVTGINFIDYLTSIRMDAAKELLRSTDYKINDIAEKSGYQQTYFNRIFKKYEGVTPGQYREMSRESSK
ncbi:helix-turn-helix domain-containing protein [Paenibacillus sp. y28]